MRKLRLGERKWPVSKTHRQQVAVWIKPSFLDVGWGIFSYMYFPQYHIIMAFGWSQSSALEREQKPVQPCENGSLQAVSPVNPMGSSTTWSGMVMMILVQPRASHMVGKCSTTKPHLQPLDGILIKRVTSKQFHVSNGPRDRKGWICLWSHTFSLPLHSSRHLSQLEGIWGCRK
jgi:hypothetical protein